MALRVLHLGKYFPPVAGGMETFCGDLHHAFAATDIESHVLVHTRPGQAPYTTPGVTSIATLGELFFTPLAVRYRRHLVRAIGRFDPQILHLHLPNPAAFWALSVAAARRLPWVVHWQSDVVASRHQWRLRLAYPAYARLEQRLIRQATTIIATSPDYAAASPALHSLDKVRVLPLGIDPSRLDARATTPQWPGGGLRLVAVGRLTYYKGFEYLLAALARVPEASLLLIGDGASRAALQREAQRLGVAQRVRFIADADDDLRNAALAAADCLCLPSIERTEAFGLVLLEAMAMGLPVVATRIAGSGVPWVVTQGGHGLLAEPEDGDSFAACLRQMGDPALRQQLRSSALANFPHFHISRVAAELGKLYRGLVDPKRR